MLNELEMDKIFERKCENTIQTCTKTYKKRRQIYLQHYDRTYAKKINIIDFVNDDCLKEIFMYVSVCERPKIAQVCKNWNRIFYSHCFSRVKKLVLSHWEYDCPRNSLEKFKTSEKKFNFVTSILDKFCIHLTELDLVAYDNSNIVPFLNKSCPNLVKLRLRIKYPFDDQKLKNAFSRMSKLRVLKIIFQRAAEISGTLIDSLENVGNTLNELILIGQYDREVFNLCRIPSSFSSIISKLKALKTIEIGGMWMTTKICQAIGDAKLNFYFHEGIYDKLDNILHRKLSSITSLSLQETYKVTDDMLHNFASSYQFLNSFTGNCSLVTDAGIKAITKMKNLKCLYLIGKNNVTDFPLCLLKRMERLELPESYKITDNSVEKILRNSPCLTELSFKNTKITLEFVRTAEEISQQNKISLKLYVQFPGLCVGIIKCQYLFVHCLCEAKHSKRNRKYNTDNLYVKK